MQQMWKKKWVNTGWVALSAITLMLLVAGVYNKNHKHCTGIEVNFDGDGNNFFIDEKGVVAVLKSNGAEPGMEIEKINLRVLENKLKSDQWIANAELYFDNKQVLKAFIKEKEPIARIFTAAGSSFYIDSACTRLPLSQKLSARIPMFTGFPSDRTVLSKPDSALLSSAKKLAMFIQADEFWKAQVSQVDITPDGFEMIPMIGHHIVLLGKDEDFQLKFDRLFSFYKQVWTKVGFEAYEKIDVRFKGQVVATLKGARSAIIADSAKAKAALENIVAGEQPDTADIIPAHLPVVKDTGVVKIKNVIKKDTTAKVLKPAPGKVSPKPAVVKPLPDKRSVKTLSHEEQAIKTDAVKQLKASLTTKKIPPQKVPPKAILKPKPVNTNTPIHKTKNTQI